MLTPFEFRWSDAIDILLVAAMVYAGVVWIRRTRAAMVATGLIILGIVYLGARALGLQLTAWILQGFFAIFVVIVVVIFQEELRQLFERLAMFSLRRNDHRPLAHDNVDVLVEALTDCARARVGALVVIPGRQPIARHVHGGIELGGAVSVPLIKSLFDPHSPGHDGAVVLEQGKVARFGVHLPLSVDLSQLRNVGTRHSAALGLGELTDALCVVVSEERGKISVASEGRLRELAGGEELSQVLRRHLSSSRPSAEGRAWLPQLIFENWLEKVISLALVLALWAVFVPGSRLTQSTYEVPVRLVNLPSEYEVDAVAPEAVEVTFSAPARQFLLFDPKRLNLSVDVSLATMGRRTFQLSEQHLSYPKEFSVDRIEPGKVKLELRKKGEARPEG